MLEKQPKDIPVQQTGRERVPDAAYELFSREGVRAVGIDAVIAKAGIAKMTLYRNFSSKQELALAFLERREQQWTTEWLRATVRSMAATPAARLLSIFDVFGSWFGKPDFEGCAFIRVLLESDEQGAVRAASIHHLANIRVFISELAAEAGIADTDGFARQWNILMKGSIIAAHEGDIRAAARAQEMGKLLLKSHGVDATK